MKFSYWFVIGTVLLMVVMFAVECQMPKKFVWNPTFGGNDHQPLGCAVFDDVVFRTMPEDYTLIDETFYQMAEEEYEPMVILSITQDASYSETDVEAIFQLAEQGSSILLVSNSFGKVLEDSLNFSTSFSHFSFSSLKWYATSAFTRDSLVWLKDSVYSERVFRYYPQLCGTEIEPGKDSRMIPLVEKWKEDPGELVPTTSGDSLPMEKVRVPVAMRYPVGEGEIVLCVTPLLFTNYGMLDAGNADYLFRYLNPGRVLPLVRTEAYMKKAFGEEQSPFRYFLSQPSLRWALYLTLLVLLLFMALTARRHQRVIPVVREPENKNLEFTELIGTLYYQKKNHADLVRKKFTYFAEGLRKNLQVDVEDESNDELLSRQIAGKTGRNAEDILRLLRRLRPVLHGKVSVNERVMQELINGMNEIEVY